MLLQRKEKHQKYQNTVFLWGGKLFARGEGGGEGASCNLTPQKAKDESTPCEERTEHKAICRF